MIKETALLATPLFPLFLRSTRRQAVAWTLTFGLFLVPHAVQAFQPHAFGILSEVTTPVAHWNRVNADAVLGNLLRLQGVEPLGPRGFGLAIAVALAVTLVLAIRALWGDLRKGDFLLRFSGLALVLFAAFFAVFWKRFVYYALPLHLFLAPFLGIYLARLRIGRWVFLGVVALSFVATLPRFADRSEERMCVRALRVVESRRRGASIAMPLPRVAEYLAENEGLAVRISPRDWVACLDEPTECLFGGDFVAGSSEALQRALVGAFCRPASGRGCDREALDQTIGRLHYLTGDRSFRVYRVDPE